MGALTKTALTASVDSVSIGDGSDTLDINADGSINVGNTVTVSSTDLDIRDLANTSDSVAIGDETNLIDLQQNDGVFGTTAFGMPIFGLRQDASGSPVSASGDAHPLVFNDDGELKVAADLTADIADDAADSGNPIKVGGRGADQGSALSALSAAGDRFDMLGDLYRRQFINDAPNVGITAAQVSVDTTAGGTNLSATPQAGRTRMIIRNEGGSDVYLGPNGVTTTSGVLLKNKDSLTLEIGEGIDLYAITASGTSTVHVLELG